MWSLCPWVSVIAATRRPLTARDDRGRVVRGVDDHHFAVVTDQPDVVGDLPLTAVEAEDAVGRHQLDHAHTP